MNDLIDLMENIVKNATNWVNNIFSWGNTFVTSAPSQLITIATIVVLSKMLKVKVDVKAGKK